MFLGPVMKSAAAAGDPLDLVVIESDNGHTFSAIIDFNRNTLQAILGGAKVYMELATYQSETTVGISQLGQSVEPAVANLDNNRYRTRKLSGDNPRINTMAPITEADLVWSAWRGGNPGAPLQSDNISYSFGGAFGTGSATSSWQFQVEEPDGSATIIVDRTLSIFISVS